MEQSAGNCAVRGARNESHPSRLETFWAVTAASDATIVRSVRGMATPLGPSGRDLGKGWPGGGPRSRVGARSTPYYAIVIDTSFDWWPAGSRVSHALAVLDPVDGTEA